MKHPIQPLEKDKSGVLRFKENKIVSFLLDATRTGQKQDMNTLAAMPFSDEDRQQFAQLIGYSLSGYGELTRYVDDIAFEAAAAMADNPVLDGNEAKVKVLEDKLQELKDALREPIAAFYGMHPNDLGSRD